MPIKHWLICRVTLVTLILKTSVFIEIQRLFYQTSNKRKTLFLKQLGPAQELFGRPEEHRGIFMSIITTL